MTFMSIGSLLEALGFGSKQNQEKIDKMRDDAYHIVLIMLKDLSKYDRKRDGKFNGIMEGCDHE